MNKDSLIKKISKETNLKKKRCKNIFDRVIELITKDLRNRKNVLIDNFGEFKIMREEMRVLSNKSDMRIVIPPKDIVEFQPSENLINIINLMNKNEITSMISIDFILSNEEAGKEVIDIIFRTMKDCFKKNKNLYIPEFGKFTMITKISSEGKKYKSIKFIPVKNLAKKINYNFDNLRIVNIRNDRCNFANNDEFDYKISDEVIK